MGVVNSSVFMVNQAGNEIEIDITHRVGLFSPTLFMYLTHIQHIDISGCRYIDPGIFVDCLVFVNRLAKLQMNGCLQFKEVHFIRMLPLMGNLKYCDISGCTELSFDAAYWLLSHMKAILMINFDPKNPVEDVDYWEILLRTFTWVHFGHNVRVCMPHYGNDWRIEQGHDCEE